MVNKRLAALVAGAALCVLAQAAEQRKACSREEASAAEDVAGRLRSWNELYDAYKRYAHCDDGAIGEGFSESVVKLLATRWTELGTLRALVQTDAGFRRFVLGHIDSTTAERDLKAIVENAAKRCPTEASALCAELEKEAQDALK